MLRTVSLAVDSPEEIFRMDLIRLLEAQATVNCRFDRECGGDYPAALFERRKLSYAR